MKKINYEYNITVWLREETYKKLKDYSEKHDIPIGVLVRSIIRKYVNEEIN